MEQARKIQVNVRLSAEDLKNIDRRMKAEGIDNRRTYIRRLVKKDASK
jgi:predicted DNA binding CopG/RHH family protein